MQTSLKLFWRQAIAFGAVTSLLLASAPAHAVSPADWTVDPGILLDDTSAPYAPNGIGSPSVAWDAQRSRYVMVFEYQSAATDPSCPHGIWGIGLATSPDALTWTVQDGDTSTAAIDPIYEPTPGDGTPFSCVMAHPSVIWRNAGGSPAYNRMHVVFKAEQDTDACAVGTPVNDCVYTGIGHANITFRPNGNVRNVNAITTLDVPITEPFGYPNIIYQNATNQYFGLVQIGADMYSYSGTPSGGWSAPILIQSPGAYSWDQDELFSPEMMCMDNGDIQVFQGGRTFGVGAAISDAGWSLMTSSDQGATWTLDSTPQFTWNNDLDWRHWSALRVGADDYQVWFTEKDPIDNHLRIRYASDTTTPGTPESRYCP